MMKGMKMGERGERLKRRVARLVLVRGRDYLVLVIWYRGMSFKKGFEFLVGDLRADDRGLIT